MDTYYGYQTALWYWRLIAARGRSPVRVSRILEPGRYAYTERQELDCRPNWADPELIQYSGGCVHPLVFNRDRRKSEGSQAWHLWNKAPRDAFSPAGEGSFVASPEFCFLQMASVLSFSELVLLGMEFCGFYCLDPTEDEGFGKRPVALTSCARIRDFLAENEGARGRRAAEVALSYVADGAASPMESAIYLLLVLPYKRGGYGLPRPLLNYEIKLDEKARKLSGGRSCWGDLCWPDSHLDLEYLGRPSHEGANNMLSDRRRTLAIEEAGYEVIEITKEQVFDLVAFDIVARRIAAKLGKRLDTKKCGVAPERQALSRVLLDFMALENVAAEKEDVPETEEGRVFGRRA